MSVEKQFPYKSVWTRIVGVFAVSVLCLQLITAQTTETFNFTGSVQTWTVPAGVTQVTINCFGAQGVGLNGFAPGNGGRAQGVLAVTPGQVLNIYVGGTNGFNGGGVGLGGAHGGGASDVRVGGTALANRVIVAGGGGGAGGDNWICNVGTGHGGGGTAVGTNFVGGAGGAGYTSGTGCGANGGATGGIGGSGTHGGGGGGGGSTSGGGGASSSIGTAQTGTLGQGGNSYNSPSCGATGGGGGGYYGGGGAAGNNCGAGRGGGGSSWTGTLTSPTFQAGVQSGNGKVEITHGGGGGGGGGAIETICYDLVLANTNMNFDCGSGNFYVCSGENLLLNWTDAGTDPVVGGTVELDFGVNCSSGPRTVLLNGTAQSSTVNPLAQCTCAPVPSLATIDLNPANYMLGAPNSLSIASNGTCLGLRLMPGNIYATVCIDYQGDEGGEPACNPPTIVCPPDMTAMCVEDIELDPEDAVATPDAANGCSIEAQWVTQPHVTGAKNCPGTTYEYTYKVADNGGNVASCIQTWTIGNNAAPTISVPAGGTVSCYDEIEVSNDDATVTTSCGGEYELKILPPVLNGNHECPGTTYTYAYRVRDICGREVIANRVFTIGSNPAPTIVAPPDMTISCNYFAELNPAYAEVTTGCTLGYTTTVTGPTTTGTANCPGATYTYTYTVTDECGRTASDTRKFTIANTAPVFLTCPSVPLIINCEDDGWQQIVQAWLASVQASSSCGTALNVTNNYNPNTQGLCINNGTRTVRWMATDNCGRTSICEQMLIVADTEPPVFVTAPQNELVVCNYITQDKLDAWVDAHGNAVVDDCWSNITWTTTPNNPTINCGGNPGPTSLTVTFIATDGCGNKSSMDATFTALPAIGFGGSNEEDLTEESLQLFQNQPNPFNDQTTISFYLPEATKAILSIYDVSGKLLKEIKGDYSEGMNMEEINRSDLQGAGMLYYKLSTATETATQRMILLD